MLSGTITLSGADGDDAGDGHPPLPPPTSREATRGVGGGPAIPIRRKVRSCCASEDGVDVFDEARAKKRRRDTEDKVVGCCSLGEAGLRKAASTGIAAASDGIEVLHPAIRTRSIRLAIGVEEEREARLAHRPRAGNERRNGVPGPIDGGVGDLWIGGRTGAADCRLRVTSSTTAGIEARAKSGTGFNGAGN